MASERRTILAELPLPLGPQAGLLAAIEIAVALEDALGVTLTDEQISVARLGQRESIESVLDKHAR